jgi:hypothetical protein
MLVRRRRLDASVIDVIVAVTLSACPSGSAFASNSFVIAFCATGSFCKFVADTPVISTAPVIIISVVSSGGRYTVGTAVGNEVGDVGIAVGIDVGDPIGCLEGIIVGIVEGVTEGRAEGKLEGDFVGFVDGKEDGTDDGYEFG